MSSRTLPNCTRRPWGRRVRPEPAAPPAVRARDPVPYRAGCADPPTLEGDVARIEGILAVPRTAAPARVAVQLVGHLALEARPAPGVHAERMDALGHPSCGRDESRSEGCQERSQVHAKDRVRGNHLKTSVGAIANESGIRGASNSARVRPRASPLPYVRAAMTGRGPRPLRAA